MENFFISVIIILGILVIVCLYKAVFGPTVIDRIIAVGVIGTKTTVFFFCLAFTTKELKCLLISLLPMPF
jgi:multicomponent Na+:H+ antiporter subunit F